MPDTGHGAGVGGDVRYECDLVMKGGLTSGIVYPPAIVEIARDHRFRSIGGSSAGAIAAATTAAAEYGRHSLTGGFPMLAELPGQLREVDATGRTRLQRLFQAQPSTSGLFDLFWIVRSTKGKQRRDELFRRLKDLGTVPGVVTVVAVLASLVAAVLLVAAIVTGEGWGIAAAAVLLALVLALSWSGRSIARAISGGMRLAQQAPAAIRDNHHGICNGRTASGSDGPALTDWLYELLQMLAGRHDDGLDAALKARPLTYGDLRERGIELVTMTTDLTRATPEVFPFVSGGWAFDAEELRELFPEAVVHHLLTTAPAVTSEDRLRALDRAGLHPLPANDDLPILLGARMSLSFPLLLSAVPLYAWLPQPDGDGWTMDYVKCWFSDGGITSNMPVHLFDKPLPSRPTYAINLGGGGEATDDCGNIWRPLAAGAGRSPGNVSIGSAAQFLSAVFGTMQNWSDNALIRSPGYRDRICTVRLGKGEGGMNLDMPPETIDRLARRGALAGENLAWIQRGTYGSCPPPPPPPPSPTTGSERPADRWAEQLAHQWDVHRFIRYRTFLGGLARYLSEASDGFRGPGDYSSLGEHAAEKPWFPFHDDWTQERDEAVRTDLTTMFEADLERMGDGAPAGSALGFNPRAAGSGRAPRAGAASSTTT